VAVVLLARHSTNPSCCRNSVTVESEGGGVVVHDYELMVILDPETDERTVAPSLEAFLEVIRKDGGNIENLDIWGKRRLAYEIKKKTEGIYAVVNFTASSEATAELDRQLRLSEAVMRTKVLRQDEAAVRLGAPEEAPVAQKVSLSGGSKRRKSE